MNDAELEVAIIQALITAEDEARTVFTPQQRAVFRIGFIFGADWHQKRIISVLKQKPKAAA